MDPVTLLLLSSITTDWVWLLIFTRFLDHTQRRTTIGRTPLNEWSVRRRPLSDNTQQLQQTNIHAPRRAEDFYLPLKIRRLRPGLNPRTWIPKASTLPLDHRSRSVRNDMQNSGVARTHSPPMCWRLTRWQEDGYFRRPREVNNQ